MAFNLYSGTVHSTETNFEDPLGITLGGTTVPGGPPATTHAAGITPDYPIENRGPSTGTGSDSTLTTEIGRRTLLLAIGFLLNYQQHKVVISANYIFPLLNVL